MNRGYTSNIVTLLSQLNDAMNRNILLHNYTNKKYLINAAYNTSSSVFVTHYTPVTHSIVNQSFLSPSSVVICFEQFYTQLFSTKPRIVFKNNPNLLQLLSHTKIT